ncbi:MAG: hypothetical protein EOO13_01390 [Chitinophagaceae bacterium]|nr:MAG: hypothetical protein EOO13_01390 [Chitinophagaceae bacterium]
MRNQFVPEILFIGKKDDHFSTLAADYLTQHLPQSTIVYSAKREAIPEIVQNWKGDYIISYLSQWIIPAEILANARIGALNLHPGSPEYPGIGCTNFAIYNKEKEFGITCHYMLPKVDSGAIVKVSRFPIYSSDSVYSLTMRCYAAILNVFFELLDEILAGKIPVASGEQWQRKAYTRKQLNELCELTRDMSEKEIEERIKATTYGEHQWAHYK